MESSIVKSTSLEVQGGPIEAHQNGGLLLDTAFTNDEGSMNINDTHSHAINEDNNEIKLPSVWAYVS